MVIHYQCLGIMMKKILLQFVITLKIYYEIFLTTMKVMMMAIKMTKMNMDQMD